MQEVTEEEAGDHLVAPSTKSFALDEDDIEEGTTEEAEELLSVDNDDPVRTNGRDDDDGTLKGGKLVDEVDDDGSSKRRSRKRRKIRRAADRASWTLWEFCRSEEVKKRKNTIAAALILSLLGTVFLIIGIYELEQRETLRGVALSIIGSLCILPGGYGCYVLYKVLQNRPGYHFNQLPSYDE